MEVKCEICGNFFTKGDIYAVTGIQKCPICRDNTVPIAPAPEYTLNEDGRLKYPTLSVLFFIFAILSIISGTYLCNIFWPGDPGYGQEWKMVAYTSSLMWFFIGIGQAAFLAAIGQALHYLNKIAYNTIKAAD